MATFEKTGEAWQNPAGARISAGIGAYPELYSLIGSKVPDYRGLFLRGLGGSSLAIGQVQPDQMRPVTGQTGLMEGHSGSAGNFSGSLYIAGTHSAGGLDYNAGYYAVNIALDTSRLGVNFSGADTHPVNTAVRYLIRALP